MKWFRYYTEALNDPKVQRLPGKLFKFWVNVLCLARMNDGILPELEEIGFALRLRPHTTEAMLDDLIDRGLLDTSGTEVSPHNWEGRQYKSDDVTERVREHRIRASRNGTGTLPEPSTQHPQRQIQSTDSESETEQTQNSSGGGRARARKRKAESAQH